MSYVPNLSWIPRSSNGTFIAPSNAGSIIVEAGCGGFVASAPIWTGNNLNSGQPNWINNYAQDLFIDNPHQLTFTDAPVRTFSATKVTKRIAIQIEGDSLLDGDVEIRGDLEVTGNLKVSGKIKNDKTNTNLKKWANHVCTNFAAKNKNEIYLEVILNYIERMLISGEIPSVELVSAARLAIKNKSFSVPICRKLECWDTLTKTIKHQCEFKK